MLHTAEHQRLAAHRHRTANWKLWGPYLSERAWGTVREDYSASGDAWGSFPHDHARSRTYRWNEDGLAGISDRNQYLCFALALWNGHDPILKERLFGLTGPEGNHGEDVKEYYFYLDNTPTHSHMRMVYKYPQRAFPYAQLVAENARRGPHDFEYELLDTGIFDQDRYFDIEVEYAKAGEADILILITVHNRGPEPAVCHVLPTLWFRNTWHWGYPHGPMRDVLTRPALYAAETHSPGGVLIQADHPTLGAHHLYAAGQPDLWFTENETNTARLFGTPNHTPYVKDAFHRHLINGEAGAINPARRGTKAAVHYALNVEPGVAHELRLRLVNVDEQHVAAPFEDFDILVVQRQREADEFYAAVQAPNLGADEQRVQRQAFAGMLWTKQLYYYDIEQWLDGDPNGRQLPDARWDGRNSGWRHLHNFDVISMPDKWEYPWYATWDLAFHCLPLAMIDPDFAKRQLTLVTREWYMHPSGQLPAYEWNYEDVNPPVHAWAIWQVYQLERAATGTADRAFLESVFHKLLLNFTWWVNRKDADGNNVFQGGFLGMDNISVFDRSADLPLGGHLDQSDGTAWMGFFSLMMLRIALELAVEEPLYQDLATKFFEHFLWIADAMTHVGGRSHALWNEEDGFFYDALHLPDDQIVPLRVRSLVGLLPVIAVAILDPVLMEKMPAFARRMQWFVQNRPQLVGSMADITTPGHQHRRLVSILTRERLVRVLGYMLDEDEFLSPYGIRSLSKHHAAHPYVFHVDSTTFTVRYTPAESDNRLFGGNSNWRGPIWMPINYLLIEALRQYHAYYGDDLRVEFPTGSGHKLPLNAVADELAYRLVRLFLRREDGTRPIFGGVGRFQHDPHWRDLLLFHEYFNGDDGAGLGASHQTGWTGLVANLIQHGALHGAVRP